MRCPAGSDDRTSASRRPLGDKPPILVLTRDRQRFVAARIDWRRELIVASTAVGSYPQWDMQLAHRGSRPLPYFDQSVSSTSSR